ncbi:MAG TPA: NAD(P)-dependent oxidoreductase [Gaiellaceae bacterium]|nr:NAD(P)-dependent oxidoreductase [Gaiellaceae bacterium]
MARIAFIGLGTMGLPMARNLVAAGHEVVGCDVDPERARVLGADVAATPVEAAEGADFALLSLPAPDVVERVAAELPARVFLVDMSTGPPALARRLAERFESALDSPVSGGPRGAESATLTIMAGGRAGDFARAAPVLEALGRPVHVGGPGAGQAAKLCNNLIAGVTMASIAEACALATAEGLDPATLYDLLTTSTGDSRVLRTRFPLEGADSAHPVASGYEALFALDLIAKDLALAEALAEEQGVSVPLAEAALAAYRAAQAEGLGHLDYSAVYLSSAPAP